MDTIGIGTEGFKTQGESDQSFGHLQVTMLDLTIPTGTMMIGAHYVLSLSGGERRQLESIYGPEVVRQHTKDFQFVKDLSKYGHHEHVR